ncbi:hypothetical protein, partial [Ferrovum sp.]|uniref:hypothetical protein n=1 Tax=Ferrovum sp. TaxID=2609467 RepID=UPI0026132C81
AITRRTIRGSCSPLTHFVEISEKILRIFHSTLIPLLAKPLLKIAVRHEKRQRIFGNLENHKGVKRKRLFKPQTLSTQKPGSLQHHQPNHRTTKTTLNFDYLKNLHPINCPVNAFARDPGFGFVVTK